MSCFKNSICVTFKTICILVNINNSGILNTLEFITNDREISDMHFDSSGQIWISEWTASVKKIK